MPDTFLPISRTRPHACRRILSIGTSRRDKFLAVPGFGKVEHEFLVEGKGEITVRYASRHGGKLTKTVKLE